MKEVNFEVELTSKHFPQNTLKQKGASSALNSFYKEL